MFRERVYRLWEVNQKWFTYSYIKLKDIIVIQKDTLHPFNECVIFHYYIPSPLALMLKTHLMTSSSVLVISESSPVVEAWRLAMCTGVTSAEVLVSESSLKGLCRNVGLRDRDMVLMVPAEALITTQSLTTVWGSDPEERGPLTGSVKSPSVRKRQEANPS